MRQGVEELAFTKCGKTKPVADFYPHATIARGYQYWCRRCAHEERMERAKIPVDPRTRRRHALWSQYRMRVGDYDRMYERQRGLCAICGILKKPWEPVSLKYRQDFLVVDHDQASGMVRGLLSWNCNCGIGHLVGENVHAATADLRTEPTFHDASTSLHEVAHVQEHLAARTSC